VRGVVELGGVDEDGPADAAAFRGRDRSGVRGSLHLTEQRQQHDRQLRHRIVGVAGVDLDRVGEVADTDLALGELVDQVQGVADRSTKPVEVCARRSRHPRARTR
jgi:hypothetical protein